MLLTDEEKEVQFHQRFAEQQRAYAVRKFANHDRDYTLEDVWVAFAWITPNKAEPSVGQWFLAGFRRKRHLRRVQTMGRFFAKIRRRLGVDKKTPVMLLDLKTAQRRMHSAEQSWRTRPPQFQSRKPKLMLSKKPALLTKRTPKVRAPLRAKVFSKTTKFVVLGRRPKERKLGYLFLGPLQSTQKRLATFEAKRLFPVYTDRLIIGADSLSKPLRDAMLRNKKVRAGVTRILWPEVPPTFEEVWDKLAQAGKVSAHREEIYQQWTDDGMPWLTRAWIIKQVKARTPVKSGVVWKARQFHCVKCKGTGSTPSTIQHASPLCVPISSKESAACARKTKLIAKRNADKLRKRKARRDTAKAAKEKAQARKRAAKKAARTRARKTIGGKASVTSSKKTASPSTRRSASKNAGKNVKHGTSRLTIQSVARLVVPERLLGRLKIVAVLRSVTRR